MNNRRGVLRGMLLGIGAMWASRKLRPLFGPLISPLLKQSMKATMMSMERARERAAELGETMEDIWAEAQQELEEGNIRPLPPEELSSGDMVD